MVRPTSTQARNKLRLRSALLLGTAIGLGAAGQAHAQSATVVNTGPGNITYSEAGTVTGTPFAIALSTPDGAIVADVGTVTSTATGGETPGGIVTATVQGANTLDFRLGTLTGTGGGQLRGIATRAGTGLTTITAGGITMRGLSGIYAESGGNVVINAGPVNVTGFQAQDADGNGLDIHGIAAGRGRDANGDNIRVGGSVTINASSVTVTGGENAAAINADAMGDISVTVGAIRSEGEGVDIFSEEGNASVTFNGDVDVAEGAASIDAAGVSTVNVAQGVTVRAGGGAIEAEGTGSVVINNLGRVINTGANGESGQGALLAEAEGDGTVTIVSNYAESNASDTEGFESEATISAMTEAGAISITARETVTNGTSMIGILAQSDSGAIAIDSTRLVNRGVDVTGAATADGIVALTSSGDVVINSQSVEVASGYGSAIAALSGGSYTGTGANILGGNVTVNSGTAIVTGAGGAGITVGTTGGVARLTSVSFTGAEAGSFNYYGQLTQAPGSLGLSVVGALGVEIDSGSVRTGGTGITATSAQGRVTIDSDSVIAASVAGPPPLGYAGIFANGRDGVNITSGSVSVTNGIGISATSGQGKVTIATSGDTVAQSGVAIRSAALTRTLPNGQVVLVAPTPIDVEITTGANSTTASGNASAILVNASRDVIVANNGTATSGGAASTISVFAGNTATITSNVTTNTGNGAAIVATGVNGVSITAGTVTAGVTQGVNVVNGVATTSGNAVLDLGSVTGTTVGGQALVYGQANNGAVSIVADNVVNASQSSVVQPNGAVNGNVGSGVNGTGRGVTIVAGNVDAQGWAVRASTNLGAGAGAVIPLNDGHVSITTTGAITSRATNAISINGNAHSFDLTIGENSVVTGYGSATVAGGARVGDIVIDSKGEIRALGASDGAIGTTATGGGNVTVASNRIIVAAEAPVSGTFVSGGIAAVSQNGNGAVSVSSTEMDVTGAGRYGIYANAAGTGAIAIGSGELTIDGANADAIGAVSVDGAITIASDSIVASGAGSYGINARSTNGDITIASASLVHSGASNDRIVEAIYAETAGNIAIDAGLTDVAGYGSSAIAANSVRAGGNIAIASDTAITRGDDNTAIYAFTPLGDIAVDSGSITSSGNFASGIGANTRGGAVTVASGTITTTGTSSYGIGATGTNGVTVTSQSLSATGQNAYGVAATTSTGDARVTSGDLTAGRFGVLAQSASGNTAISLTGNTSVGSNFTPTNAGGGAQAGYGARGIGDDVTIETAAGTTTTATDTGLEAIARQAASVTNAGSVVSNGGNAIGIKATGITGVTIASNAVAVGGTAADPGVDPATGYRIARGGIVAEGGAGPVSIDSGTVAVAGEYRYGIYARSTGAITVGSDDLTLASADSAGIMVLGGDGAVAVDSSKIVTTGDSGTGISVSTTGGAISVTAADTRVQGTGYAGGLTGEGIAAFSDTGAITIDSGYAGTAGLYGSAISTGTAGDISITSATAATSGDGGVAVYGRSEAGNVTIASGALTTTGAGTLGINATAVQGTASVTSTSLAVTDGFGILARGAQGATVTTGALTSTGYGVNAEAGAGTAAVTVNGAVASSTGYGVRAAGLNGTVTVNAGASVRGGTSAIQAEGTASNLVVNNGAVTGGSGAAIVATIGRSDVANYGTITGGANGPAVQFGGFDDSFAAFTGSAVNGVVDMGAGNDVAFLSGSVNTASAAQTIGQFANLETLSVESGYWTAQAYVGEVGTVRIASGAAVQVNDLAGESTIGAGNVVNDGRLLFNFATNTLIDLDGAQIGGSGSVSLIGGGRLVLADASGLTYTGGTSVENGELLLTDVYGGDITTSGAGVFRLGEGGSFTGDLVNNGTFIYDRSSDFTFVGDFSGTGGLTKNGAGRLSFDGLYAFTGTTTINGGSVAFTGQLATTTEINLTSGTLDLSQVDNGRQTIGELAGTQQGSIALGGSQLTVNQATNTTFAGTITGTGGITKSGSGTLNLTGTNTYSGTTQVAGGTLRVNGALPNSSVVVDQGATLGGNGSMKSLQLNGGTLAPGNSIGRLTVNGPIVFTAGSIYEVEVNAAGAADRIDGTSTAALGGATLRVLAEPGRYRGLTSYTILTATGGVSGQFGTVTSNFAFLTPSVTYGANTVTLNLRRNNASFGSFANTSNEAEVAAAITALGGGNALFEETLLLADTAVRPSFTSLSGELHAGISGGMVENAQAVRRAMLSASAPVEQGSYGWAQLLGGAPIAEQLRPAIAALLSASAPVEQGSYGWAQLLGNWGTADANDNSARLETDQSGLLGGVGFAGNGLKAEIGVGALTSSFNGLGRADADTTMVVGALGYAMGGLNLAIGGSYAWHTTDTRRTTSLGAIADTLIDEVEGNTSQIFGEVGFGIETGAMLIGPFIGASHVAAQTDAVSESGGITALNIAENTREVTFGTAGVRVRGIDGWNLGEFTVAPYASAAYRRAWGERYGPLTASFAGATGTFGVLGPVIAKDAAELGLGLELSSGPVRVSAGYNGSIASEWKNHSAQMKVSIGF